MCWLILQMATTARLGPSWSQEPHPSFLLEWQRMLWQETESETEYLRQQSLIQATAFQWVTEPLCPTKRVSPNPGEGSPMAVSILPGAQSKPARGQGP